MTQVQPVFIFSLPRSGSTLLQRILSTHPGISTTAEPWLLLPLLYARHGSGVVAEYDHQECVRAIDDFVARLPEGTASYQRALRRLALELYADAAHGSPSYFLDKTPRYHLVAREVLELFPGCKAIFLWRNPLAVAASMMQTWSAGRWNLERFGVDLFRGLANLVDAYGQNEKSCCSLRFEDLVAAPEAEIRRVFEYLGLPDHQQALTAFSTVELQGRMGDPTGVEAYDSIAPETLQKWTTVMNTPLRKRWARRYLRWAGQDRLAIMGYSSAELLGDLAKAPTSLRHLASDALRMSLSRPRRAVELAMHVLESDRPWQP